MSTYSVEILSSFSPELQLKGTESAIKSKLIELLTQLKGFKFVTKFFLVFKKTVWQFLMNLKSRNNYQWKRYWWSVSINLCCSYN